MGMRGLLSGIGVKKTKKRVRTSQAEDAIVFELEGGKIKYWREYIDKQSQGN
jgi:limonene-1,2-epoxide hydrolase